MASEPKTKTKIEQVIGYITAQIKSRNLLPNTRLPSVRKLSTQLGFSISTVLEAYERLVATGVIEARKGAGYFLIAPIAPLSIAKIQPLRAQQVDPLWISRQALEAEENALKPGCGWLPEDWLPQDSLRKSIRHCINKSSRILTNYATPQGLPELRELLALRMQQKYIDAHLQQIMLMDSATQAIDLLCRFLLKPNDTVLVDDPCYFNFQALLKVHGVNVIGVPYTAHGVDVQAFSEAIQQYRPRLYITNATIHNPTGAVLSIQTAYQILRLVEQANMLVIEDDIYADFENEIAPRYAALDGLKYVIYIGSFSKTLSASIRCGYIATRVEWMNDLIDLKIATSFSHHYFSTELLYAVLTDGAYRKHVESVKLRLNQHMQQSIDQLEQLGMQVWLKPRAGMFLWCELPKDVDAGILSQKCLQKGVILAPGNSFSPSQNFHNFLRFNVAHSQHPKVFSVLETVINKQL